MKTYLAVFTLFMIFVFGIACNRLEKTQSPKEKVKAVEIEQKAAKPENTTEKTDPFFKETQTNHSLYGPQSITRNILQDRQGYIWLATWEGIIRYDGQSFVNFTNKEGLKRFHVFSLLEDSKGILWFGMIGGGIYRYDGKNFINFTKKNGLIHNSVGCFYEDRKGNIWIGTEGGISVFDGKNFRNYTTDDGLMDNDINAIIQDKNGKFWIGARGEASFYDGNKFSKITNDLGAPFLNTRTIIRDSKDNIWLGGNSGFWRYDNHLFTRITSNFVGYVYEDHKGNIWTSSVSPQDRRKWILSRFDASLFINTQLDSTTIKIEEGMLFGIYEDNKGGIWHGSLNGTCRYYGGTFNCFRDPSKEP